MEGWGLYNANLLRGLRRNRGGCSQVRKRYPEALHSMSSVSAMALDPTLGLGGEGDTKQKVGGGRRGRGEGRGSRRGYDK